MGDITAVEDPLGRVILRVVDDAVWPFIDEPTPPAATPAPLRPLRRSISWNRAIPATGSPQKPSSQGSMAERPAVHLPPLAGRQGESWAALLELSPSFGQHWLLVGGQMVFVHESTATPETSDQPTTSTSSSTSASNPTGLATMHHSLRDAGFTQDTHEHWSEPTQKLPGVLAAHRLAAAGGEA